MKNIIKKIKYIFLLNHWDYGVAHPSWIFNIRMWMRKNDFFGYWSSYRRWEESLEYNEYKNIRFKTIAWIKSLISKE